MSEPRIFQGWPLTEVSMAFLEGRYDTDCIERGEAAEVVPGVFVQVISHGDYIMPDGTSTTGARIAVWDERMSIITQLRELVEELHGLADHYHAERGKLSSDDEESMRRIQTRAAYLSGLEFAFGDSGHRLSKLLRQITRISALLAGVEEYADKVTEEIPRPERQDLSWFPGFGSKEENDATS